MILIQLKGKNTGIKNLLIRKAAKSPEIFDVSIPLLAGLAIKKGRQAHRNRG